MSLDFIREQFGLSFPDSLLLKRLRAWATQRQYPESADPNFVNRYALEHFLQIGGLMPKKCAALRLGMTEKSFDNLTEKVGEKNGFLLQAISGLTESLVFEDALDKLSGEFPSMRNRIFADHDDFCRRLHEACREHLSIEIDSVRCATALLIGEHDFAYFFDQVSLEPVGIRYQLWLKASKPLMLHPDVIGLKTYFRDPSFWRPYTYSAVEDRYSAELIRLNSAGQQIA
ncbi:MAG: hypothetical protein HY791_11905 [Deltaproteobacteria bacterium]|nr:hypothetical protein [Deltaproteobacteria bacterium]